MRASTLARKTPKVGRQVAPASLSDVMRFIRMTAVREHRMFSGARSAGLFLESATGKARVVTSTGFAHATRRPALQRLATSWR